MEAHQQNFPYEDEPELVDEVAALQRRHRVSNGGNENNGNDCSKNGNEFERKENGESETDNKLIHSHNSVYFDELLGKWKCRHCNWNYGMGSPLTNLNETISGYLNMPMNFKTLNQQGPCFILETKGTESLDGVLETEDSTLTNSTSETSSEDADVRKNSVEIPKSLVEGMNDQSGEILDNKGISNSSLTPLEESHEEENLRTESINNEMNDHRKGILDEKGFPHSSLTPLEESHEEENLRSESVDNEISLARDFDWVEEVENNDEIQESLIKGMIDQSREILDNTGFFNSSLTPIEETHEEINLRSKSVNNEISVAEDFDLVEEVDQGDTEFDVEKVLHKQNTHDLYCPNCHSCITKRVILRRRKAKIRNAHRKPKNSKSEKISLSELDANIANSTTIEIQDTVGIRSISNEAPLANASDSDKDPEVFRCLACFSFFMPTGDGFKLFRLFGDSSANETVQNIQRSTTATTIATTTATSRNWFFNMFATGDKKMTSEQATEKKITIKQGNETEADQNGLVSSIASPLVGLVNDLETASLETRKELVNSSTQDSKYLQIASSSVEVKSDKSVNWSIEDGKYLETASTAMKSDNATATLNTGTILYQDQNGHSSATVPSVVVNIGEDAEDTSLSPMQAGTNISVSSNSSHHEQASSILATPLPTKLFGEGLNNSTFVGHETRTDTYSSSQTTSISKTTVGEAADGSVEKNTEHDVTIVVETRQVEHSSSHMTENNDGSSTATTSLLQSGNQTHPREQRGGGISVEILKSIVYGGLIESITSLGVVSSAAGAGSATLNIVALGLANLIGGLIMIVHHLMEMKRERSGESSQPDRYQETLGRRERFSLHAPVAILSFLIFGMLPPVLYGFSFRKTDDKDLKLVVVGSASLVCIFFLAIGKAHVRPRPSRSYIITILYFLTIGFMSSGASYVVGNLISKFVERVGWFNSDLAPTMLAPERIPAELGWASY